jgi:PilZ domain
MVGKTAESSPTGQDAMATSGYRRGERRRTTRVTLAVPLRVDGQNVAGEAFTVRTHTYTVSQYGCSIVLQPQVLLEQTLVLMNEHTRKSAISRVVSTRRHRDGKVYVGVVFLSPSPGFWGIVFSKPGARSLKRQYDSKNSL